MNKHHDKNAEQSSEEQESFKESTECKNSEQGAVTGEITEQKKAEAERSLETETPSDKIAELEEQLKDLQEQYLRKAADFENYRKRMIKEKQEAIDYANTNLLLDLVQILDDFDRAIEAGKNQDSEPVVSAFAEGVVMIKNQMTNMLGSKYGLTYYPSKGEKFDPNIHEAVSMVQTAEVTEPTVGEEAQKGYKLKERVIRHAKVMVLMPQTKEEAEDKKDSCAEDSKN